MKLALEYIKSKLGDQKPDIGIILGSGLGKVVDILEDPIVLEYADITDMPLPTVKGHTGCIYIGKLGKHMVLCLQGRIHLYEGHPPQLIYSFIEFLQEVGLKELIITNAAGSLYQGMPAGSLMLIKDHINLSGRNPLEGPHKEPYFPDMSKAYDEEMRNNFKKVAQKENVNLYEGVYLMTLGPNFETPSEIKMFRLLGADAVGMSTVPEVISAVHCGMKVLGISVISNLGTGLTDEEQSHDDVLKNVGKASEKLADLIQHYLEEY